MKRLIGAVAATALLVCPLAATAQMHDGGGHRDGAVANWRGDGHQGQDGVRMGAGRMGASPWRGERTFGAHADGGRDWRAARFSGGGRWDGNAQRSFGHRGGYYDGRLRQGREEEGFGVRRGDDGFRRDRDDRGFGFGRERDEDGFGFGGSPWIYSYPDDSDYYAPFYDDGSGWGYGVGAPAQDWTDYGVAQEDGGYGPARAGLGGLRSAAAGRGLSLRHALATRLERRGAPGRLRPVGLVRRGRALSLGPGLVRASALRLRRGRPLAGQSVSAAAMLP